jgi:hypothetical protein
VDEFNANPESPALQHGSVGFELFKRPGPFDWARSGLADTNHLLIGGPTEYVIWMTSEYLGQSAGVP